MNKLVFCFLLLCSSLTARSQGTFRNLDFGLCQIPKSAPEGYYASTQAIPFWTASIGGKQVNSLYYNNILNGAPSVVLLNTNTSYPWYYGAPIPGDHYAVMMTSGYLTQSTFLPVSIAQTGQFPASAKTLLFFANVQDDWEVTVNGVQIPVFIKSGTYDPSIRLYQYEADISQFAGRTNELKFLVTTLQPGYGDMELGDVQFSDIPVSFGGAITWGPATNIESDSDVLNAGTLVYAYTWSGITSTVNAVSFTGSAGINGETNVLAPAFSKYGPAYFTSKAAPFSALSTAYSNILIGADYVVGLPVTVILENLTIGRNYAVQVWVNDPRGPENARSESITSPGGNTNTLRFSMNATNTNPGGSGQYIIGNFTADATKQTFTLNGATGDVSQMNALQLRDVTPPPTVWSSVTIKAGQTWTLGFNSLALLNNAVYGGNSSVTFFFASGGPATAILDLLPSYLPLTFSLAWTNPPPTFGASAPGIWTTDHQGWVRLHVVTGEVTFAFVNVDVHDWPVGLYESTFYQPPTLSEVLSTNSSGILQLTLQWPLFYNQFPMFSPNPVQYTLQSSLSGGSGSWSDVTVQPVVVGALSSVTVDAAGPQRFYRLINTNFSMTLQ